MQPSIVEESQEVFARHAARDQWRKEFLLAVAQGKPLDENARRVFEWALELDPECAAALNGLGRVFLKQKQYGLAEEFFGEASARNFTDPRPPLNAAVACDLARNFRDAIDWTCQSIDLAPTVQAYLELVSIHEQLGNEATVDQAIAAGLELDPANHELLFARSCQHLKRGEWADGWSDYEHRPSEVEMVEKLDETPKWAGESLEGKTLLVWGDQGFGDQIMFSRYRDLIPGRVVFYTRNELARLFPCEVITSDREAKDVNPDYWVSLGSLPHILGVPAPAAQNYITAKPQDVERFAALIPDNQRLRVGFAWRGNPEHTRDKYRSVAWELLEPLTKANCDFYSLQMGDSESPLVKLRNYCHDWADMAAAIANLDIVIAVDTGVAHLAAAMGKPTIIILSTLSDWRWGRNVNEHRTAWYGSAKLFRQEVTSGWEYPVSQVAQWLKTETEIFALHGPRTFVPVTPAPAIQTKTCRHGGMTFLASDKWLGRALDLYGEWSESEVALYRDLVKPGDVVVEAGANVGAHTIPLANLAGLDGSVWAFEPNAQSYKLLHENVLRNCAGVKMARMALGAAQGTVFYDDAAQGVSNPGGTEMKESGDHKADMVQLDQVKLKRLDFLKADVEGMELDVLRGAVETIARCRPLIYIENDRPENTQALLRWLTAHGYRCYQHHAPLYNPENFNGYRVNVFGHLVSMMLLCVPKERFLSDDLVARHELSRVRLSRRLN